MLSEPVNSEKSDPPYCTMYSVQCTLCTVYIDHSIQCTLYNVQCTLYTMINVHST